MKRIFIELDYESCKSDLDICIELEKLLEDTNFKLRRFNSVNTNDLFRLTVGNG